MAGKRAFLDLTNKRREEVEKSASSAINNIHDAMVKKLETEANKYNQQEKDLQAGFDELKAKSMGLYTIIDGEGYFGMINNYNPVFKHVVYSLEEIPTKEYKAKTKELGFAFENDLYNYLSEIFENNLGIKVQKPAQDTFYTQTNNLIEEVINDLYNSFNNKEKRQSKEEFAKRIGLHLSKGSIYTFKQVSSPKVDISISGSDEITLEGDLDETQKKFRKALIGVNFQLKSRKKLISALEFGRDTISRRFEKFYSVITSIGYDSAPEFALKLAYIDNTRRKNDNTKTVKQHTPHLKAYYEVIGPLQSTGQVNMILYNNSEDLSQGVLVRSAAGYVLDYIQGEDKKQGKRNIDYFKG